MPGVVAVITGRDMPCNTFGPSLKDQPVLADARVFHAGDGVAAVAAVTEQIAAEALDKIRVEYEPLTPFFDPLESLKLETAGRACAERQYLWQQGHQEGRRRKGLCRVVSRFRGPVPHADGRARSARAALRRSPCGTRTAGVTIYSSLGRITLGRADMARTLGIPMSRIRIDRHYRRRQFRRQERNHAPSRCWRCCRRRPAGR